MNDLNTKTDADFENASVRHPRKQKLLGYRKQAATECMNENSLLKRIVADLMLEVAVLKDQLRTFEADR